MSKSQTPPPVPPDQLPSVRNVIDLYDSYFNKVDVLNESNYKYGKMLDKDITANHSEILKTIIFIMFDDLKEQYPDDVATIESIAKATISCVNISPTGKKNANINKQLVAKLLGYILELHKLHI